MNLIIQTGIIKMPPCSCFFGMHNVINCYLFKYCATRILKIDFRFKISPIYVSREI